MKKTLVITSLATAGVLYSQSAQAAFVLTSFLPAENVVSGQNEGGLTAGSTYTNGDDALKFTIEFVDSGVTFDSVLTVSNSNGSFPVVNASGDSSVRLANGNNGTLTFTMGAVNSNDPGIATAAFDGFTSITFKTGGDGTFGLGVTPPVYTFANGIPKAVTGGSGSTLADAPGGGLMDFHTIESSFTVSPVPEPGSVALFGLGAFAIISRRRRSV